MHRNLIFYTLVIGIFGLLLWFIFIQGKQLEAERSHPTNTVEATAAPDHTARRQFSRECHNPLLREFSL